MKKYFRDETGMFIDWGQLKKLPSVDTLIDIGVGPMGTPDLYTRFNKAKLVLIDPLVETKSYIDNNLNTRDVSFYNVAVGKEKGNLTINVEDEIGRSSFLNTSSINYEGEPIDKREVEIETLDALLENEQNLGSLGIKIDTEGFELNVILGAKETLKKAKFVLAEVRHNHESFEGCYDLKEFIEAMQLNGFVLSMILTAKPFIADLCFYPLKT